MPSHALPSFSVRDWRTFLEEAVGAGYAPLPVEAMPHWEGARALYLRHDVDLHIPGIERIAEVEAQLGLSATYFVPLTLHFNPAYPPNRDVLRTLVAAGHRIGLHYDLQTYPWELDAAWRHLHGEVSTLAEIVGAPVESIAMHFPWGGRPDVFAAGTDYVHPHAPRYAEVVYVSDSCRAWRDDTLLRLFSDDPPPRLQLNTHPELWLGAPDEDRYAFLGGALLEHTLAQHRDYVLDHMGSAWRKHPAPALHDAREGRRAVVPE